MGELILCLDLSTTSTGWAVFESKSKKLIEYGFIKGSNKGLKDLSYPIKQLTKINILCVEIKQIITKYEKRISNIIIEEVNLHKSRMSGKTLDGLHWLLLTNLTPFQQNLIVYMDSDGPSGWRTKLNLRLTQQDKILNKDRRKKNKIIKKGNKKLPIINKKHLACRYVNGAYKLKFDVDKNPNDNDIVDAIGIGAGYLLNK